MEFLEVDRLSKSFDSVNAVDEATINIEKGELLCLLGPSGSGKTTLLRLIAGIEKPDNGYVSCEGVSLNDTPSHGRGFGLMFQDLALFPHMDVFGNVAFGLRMQRLPRKTVRRRVSDLLELVGLVDFGSRRVHELSGGERQRVALARALAPSPRLLMLDEPLGALDRVLRDSLRVQIRTILNEVGVTSIYVTHDPDEALAVADTLAFMKLGRVVQKGTSAEVYRAPANEFVARAMGFKNILAGEMCGSREAFLKVHADIGIMYVESNTDKFHVVGSRVKLLIDQRDIEVRKFQTGAMTEINLFNGIVTVRTFIGREYELTLRVGNIELACVIPSNGSNHEINLGTEVSVRIAPNRIKILEL